MTEQTKAQRLADILQYKIPSMECLEEAAAELRRLDALNAELVETLKEIKSGNLPHPYPVSHASLVAYHKSIAEAALAKARGGA